MTDDQRPSPFPLRLPGSIRGQLDEQARASDRSLNSEITARLRRSLDGDSDEALLHEIVQRLERLERAVTQAQAQDAAVREGGLLSTIAERLRRLEEALLADNRR